MTRIAAVGGYVPRLRLPASAVEEAWGRFRATGIDRTAVPDADEDAVTMAHAAARRALAAADRDAGSVARLHFGTTTPPLAESDLTARLASTLGLAEGVATMTHTASTRAGVEALCSGVHADATTLVVAADCPRGDPDSRLDHAAGAGAAALLLAPEGGARIDGMASDTEPFPGTRTRQLGAATTQELGVRTYERRSFRETLVGAIDRLDIHLDAVEAAAIQAPDGDRPHRVGEALGLSDAVVDAGVVVRDTGDLGAASAVFGLVAALRDGAGRVLVGGYGSGASATAVAVTQDGSVPASITDSGDVEVSYPAALRRRGEVSGRPVQGGGAHVSLPSWRQSLAQRHRLEAGACRSCEALAFPPQGACPACGDNAGFAPVTLAESGEVVGTTTIHQGGAPPEFRDQQHRSGAYASAVVAFDGPDGGSVQVPLQVVLAGADDVSVGDEVVWTVRRIYEQEGVPRYGVKAVPATARR